jgi:hypothetical protein
MKLPQETNYYRQRTVDNSGNSDDVVVPLDHHQRHKSFRPCVNVIELLYSSQMLRLKSGRVFRQVSWLVWKNFSIALFAM